MLSALNDSHTEGCKSEKGGLSEERGKGREGGREGQRESKRERERLE